MAYIMYGDERRWVPPCFGKKEQDTDCEGCKVADCCSDEMSDVECYDRVQEGTDAVKQLGRDIATKCAHTAASEVARFLEKLCK